MEEHEILEIIATETELYAFCRVKKDGSEELYISYVDKNGVRKRYPYSHKLFKSMLDQAIQQTEKKSFQEGLMDISKSPLLRFAKKLGPKLEEDLLNTIVAFLKKYLGDRWDDFWKSLGS